MEAVPMRPVSMRTVGRETKDGICPFYEWNLENCFHIKARGAEVLKVISHCFGNYRTCNLHIAFARTPEGAAELKSRNAAFQTAQ
jgi:hypothetical protein